MEVKWHPAAEQERLSLPARELLAIQHAIQKLEAEGDRLRFPHSSKSRVLLILENFVLGEAKADGELYIEE